MNKVFGFAALVIAFLLVLNVAYHLYHMFGGAPADAGANSIGVLGIIWMVVQIIIAVVLWFASRVFMKMG